MVATSICYRTRSLVAASSVNCECNNNMNWLNSQNVGGGWQATLLETNVIEEEKQRKNKENVPFDLYLIYVEFPH